MQPNKISRLTGKVFTDSTIYLMLTLSGLSFCFLLGFPFDNHNESYLWLSIFSKVSLWDTLTKNVIHIESFRPLGMANAWLSYKISGNIYLQQILNWLFVLSSFTLLFTAVKNKILFSVLAFITCACFFAGYIYLFHLHGVFYGPFQLYVAWMACIAWKQKELSAKMLALTSAATVIATLYHTFALLVFCAFLAGYIIQAAKAKEKMQMIRLGIVLALTIIFAKSILHSKEIKSLQDLADGLFTSFRMAEVNKAFSFIAGALTVLTAIPLVKTTAQRLILCAAILFLSVLMVYIQIPVLLLWIAICTIRMITEKNWVMAGLIAATTVLPVGSSSGSPTYIVFVLMICTFVAASGADFYIHDTVFLRRLTLFSLILLFSCVAVIKAGYQVPLVASVARPILAEQEKTRQLKDILAWKMKDKEHAILSLTLYDKGGIPVKNTESSINRVNRPVTDQAGIDAYLDAFSNDTPNENKLPALYITFGNKILENKQLVFSVEGKWNGKACVFQ